MVQYENASQNTPRNLNCLLIPVGKGEAYGFSLQTLNKLKTVKSAKDPEDDSTITLLDFLITTVQQKAESVKEFVNDLAGLPVACRVEFSALQADAGKLIGSVRKISGALKMMENKPTDKKDKYEQVMSKFLKTVEPVAEKFQTRIKEIDIKQSGIM